MTNQLSKKARNIVLEQVGKMKAESGYMVYYEAIKAAQQRLVENPADDDGYMNHHLEEIRGMFLNLQMSDTQK